MHFPNYQVVQSQCAADRSVTLTGQLYQNNGVHNNSSFGNLDLAALMYSWAHDAGYYVAHIGKFINGSEVSTWNQVPSWTLPGVDEHFILCNVGSDADGIKYNWQAIERTYDRDGSLTSEALFPALAARGESPVLDLRHFDDYVRNRAKDVLNRAIASGLPFLIFIWPNVPHEPSDNANLAPVLTPDVQNRTARYDAYDNWIPPVFDYEGRRTRTGTPQVGNSGVAAPTATTLTDTSAAWTINAFQGDYVYTDGKWATIQSNTATVLTVDAWRVALSNTAASPPAVASSYSIGPAKPNINTASAHVQGASGLYSTSPGDTVGNERHRMKLLVPMDDILQETYDILTAFPDVLATTWRFYISDNGYFRGEHGIWTGKESWFRDSIRCPFWVVGPDIAGGSECAAYIANIDIAPTMCAIAGLTAPHAFDGGVNAFDYVSNPTGLDHRVLMNTQSDANKNGAVTRYYKLGATGASGVRKFYDLTVDPWEFDDVAAAPAYAALVATFKNLAATLTTCAGASCSLTE